MNDQQIRWKKIRKVIINADKTRNETHLSFDRSRKDVRELQDEFTHVFSCSTLSIQDVTLFLIHQNVKETEVKTVGEQKVPQKNLNSVLHLPEFLSSVNACNLYSWVFCSFPYQRREWTVVVQKTSSKLMGISTRCEEWNRMDNNDNNNKDSVEERENLGRTKNWEWEQVQCH